MARSSRDTEARIRRVAAPVRGARALQSERRRQHILKASGDVLLKGFADFSLRKVSAAADVRLNTVQHHFKDLDSLIYATLEFVGGDLLARSMALSHGKDGDPIVEFVAFLDEAWLVIQKMAVRKFFFELWAMALHRPVFAQMLKRMYGEYQAALAVIVQRVNPALADAEANVLARLICSWLEGALVIAHWTGEEMPAPIVTSMRMKSACLEILGVTNPPWLGQRRVL